jgi:hypothetical protein
MAREKSQRHLFGKACQITQMRGMSATVSSNTTNQENIMAGKARRTTHRSSTGKKLYAVRDKSGKFKDIQTYQRAHAADLRRKSKKEK